MINDYNEANDVPSQALLLGEFIGLLNSSKPGWTVNKDWFADPLSCIEKCGTRIPALIALLETLMPAEAGFTHTLQGLPTAKWHPLPDHNSGNLTAFHVVASPSTATAGEIGMGVLYQSSAGNQHTDAFLYVPLVKYDATGMTLVLGNAQHPIQLGLNSQITPSFTVGNVSFTGLSIVSSIQLSDAASSISVVFNQLKGTNKPNTYAYLSELLDADVSAWLLEVLVASEYWLNEYIPGTTITLGNALEVTGYISRDYQFHDENFQEDENTSTLLVINQLLNSANGTVYQQIFDKFTPAQQNIIRTSTNIAELRSTLTSAFNSIVNSGSTIYDENLFDALPVFVTPLAYTLIEKNVKGSQLVQLNSILLQNIFRPCVFENPYQLNLQNISGTPVELTKHFAFSLLDVLSWYQVPFIYLPGGGISVTSHSNADGSSSYGLLFSGRIALNPDSVVTSTHPMVELCLGDWLSNETSQQNWILRSTGAAQETPNPGIGLLLLNRTSTGSINFAPAFSLTSTGFNISGSHQKPLANVKGYSLVGVELRVNLDGKGGGLGGALQVDQLGLPLGPSTTVSAGGNLVAQNLLSSATPRSSAGDQDPVNPTFSISAAYAKGGQLAVQLYDKKGAPTDALILPINQAFGPLHCEKIGVGWQTDRKELSILFDGGIKLNTLDLELDDLSVGIPITAPGNFSGYSLDLAGMSLSFSAGEVALSGAFVKLPADASATPPRTYPEYDGSILITGGGFSVSALGSYAYATDLNGQNGFASLFIFGMLDGNIGGPAFFYVTGLAVGFGYNRQINLPDMNSLTDFPFLKVFDNPSSLLGTGPATSQPNPLTVLAHMDSYVPPQRGEYWLAAGVRFTSFDLVHTTALLTIEFGKELEIGLLGITRLSLPPATPGGNAPSYLYAELGIEVVVLPAQGSVNATALLTPNSYVIDPACKLTGGLAFYSWFGNNPHANEFVLTIGGYHPSFTPPGYYPIVPRLAFNWPVSDSVNISGDAYFALTPSAAMAGAGLSITYNDGDLHAWFIAQMDALIVWAPFQYLIDIQVNLGASYRLNLLFTTVTLKVELGASLTIWGPAMGGKAHISWYVISFTIGFGADAPAPASYLLWTNNGTGFSETLLPHATQESATGAAQLGPMAPLVGQRAVPAAGSVPVPPSGIHTITISSGLLSTYLDANQATVWIVRPNHLRLGISTAIPATDIVSVSMLNPSAPPVPLVPASSPARLISIRPMGITLHTATLNIGLTLMEDGATTDRGFDHTFQFAPTLGKVPASKWGSPLATTGTPEPNTMIDDQLLGLENIMLCPTTLSPIGSSLLLVDVATAFADQPVPNSPGVLPVSSTATPTGLVPTRDTDPQWSQHMAASLLATADTRTAVFNSLQVDFGIDASTNGPVAALAVNPSFYLADKPLIYAG